MSNEPEVKPPVPKIPPKRVVAQLRRVLMLARPEWRLLGLGTFFLAIAAAGQLAFPQAIRLMIDGALKAGDRAEIDRVALIMVGVFLVQGIASALRYIAFTNAGERTIARLRRDLYERLISQEIGFFDEHRTGELVSRLASDTTVLQNAVSANISMLLRNLAAVVGGIALLLWTSPILTGLMLSVVPPVALGAVWFGRKVRGLSRDVQDALAASSNVAEESLSGVRTVRAFAAEPFEVRRYDDAVQSSYRLAKRRGVIAGSFFGAAAFFAFSAGSLVLWYGGGLVIDGRMSAGELTSFLIYSLLVAFSLGAVAELFADFMRAAGAAERLFDLLERKPKVPITGGSTPSRVEGRLRFEHVTFSYPTRPDVTVLDALDLELRPGEVVAVVGPSGAGKSTLASLLLRFYDPKSGRITVDGIDLKTLDASWMRSRIGLVAQEPLLFSQSIADNIRYGRREATDAEVEAAARAANAHTFIEKFPDGYRTMVGERGVQLSGGQKQRVAIARAVLKDPRVLILDEATSALDAESEHLVQEALDRLLAGRTTLIIAHRLSTVVTADRVVVLEGGKIVQSGPHSALIREEGLYRKLVERQFVAA